MYDCGYNEEKYQRYYEKGKLYKKLRKYYSEYDIELIEEYLKENESSQEQSEIIKTRKLTPPKNR